MRRASHRNRAAVVWASTVRMPRETLARIAREQRSSSAAKIEFRVLPPVVRTSSKSSLEERDEEEEEERRRREKMMVISVVKVATKKNEKGEEIEEEEIARFESRENELVPGDLCEVEERANGADASATVVAKLARKFHPTRDETAKNQAGAKCKTRTDMLVQKKNEKFNTKLLGNCERRPEEDATATTTTTTTLKVVSEALKAAKAADATNNEALTLLTNTTATATATATVNGGRISAEELERMAARRISLVRATILLAESKNSESLVVATTSKAVEKEQVSQKPLASAAMNSETVCRECIFSLLHERKLSKDALREAIVRGFESATKLNRKRQVREQILETPLRDTFERALKEVANFRAPGRYELKRERVEEGRRANASASLWIAQEEDVNANAPIVVNRKRARVEEVDDDDDDRGVVTKSKNNVLTPPLLLESRNREKEEAERKKRSKQGCPQAVSPVYQPEELVQRGTLKEKSNGSSSSEDDDDDDDDVSESDDDSDDSSSSSDSDSDSSDSDSEDSETDSSDSESEESDDFNGVRERASSARKKPSVAFLADDQDTEWQNFESKDGKSVLKVFRRIGRNKIRPITEAHLAAWNAAFKEYWSVRRRLRKHGEKINLCEERVEAFENYSSKKEKKRNKKKYEKAKSDLARLQAPESRAIRVRMRRVLDEIDNAFGGKTRLKIESFARKQQQKEKSRDLREKRRGKKSKKG